MPPKQVKATDDATEIEVAVDKNPNAEPKAVSNAEKFKNLVLELDTLKTEKKESNKEFNEEIKRVEAEIKDLIKKEKK